MIEKGKTYLVTGATGVIGKCLCDKIILLGAKVIALSRSKKNLQLLKLIIPKPKFIILYRPVLECLASFVKITKAKDNEILCEQLLNRDDNFGRSLWSIQNIIKSKEDYILIKYDKYNNY